MRKKEIRFKNVFAIVFLIASLFLFALQVFSEAPGANCKDCGSVSNCQNGNGLNSGFYNCWVNYDLNWNPIGCDLWSWCGSTS